MDALSAAGDNSYLSNAYFDPASAGALLLAVQGELAGEIGNALVSRAKLMAYLAGRSHDQTALAAAVSARIDASPAPANASLGKTLAASVAMLNELSDNGVQISGVQPKYLWITREDVLDNQGAVLSSTYTCEWKPEKFRFNNAVSIPPQDWDQACRANPDAQILSADAGGVPSDSSLRRQFETIYQGTAPDGSPQAVGTRETSTYCFQRQPNLIVAKSDLGIWSQAVTGNAKETASGLLSLTEATRSELRAYERAVAYTDDCAKGIDRFDSEKAAAGALAMRSDNLQREHMRDDTRQAQPSESSTRETTPQNDFE